MTGQPAPTPSDEKAVQVVAEALLLDPTGDWHGGDDDYMAAARIAVTALKRAGWGPGWDVWTKELRAQEERAGRCLNNERAALDERDSARSLVRDLEEAVRRNWRFKGREPHNCNNCDDCRVNDLLDAVARARKDGGW